MKKNNFIRNQDTFNFFDWKWKKVPTWGHDTRKIYEDWYLKKYNLSEKEFSFFLENQTTILDAGCVAVKKVS